VVKFQAEHSLSVTESSAVSQQNKVGKVTAYCRK